MSKAITTFQLIKSLTQNEKRFFRLFANLTKGEKNYMHLFDALESMAHYDAGTLKKKLQGKRMKLSHEQNYLRRQILRAMRTFHSENHAEYQLNGMLSDIRFLFAKEQFRLCSELLDSAIRLAGEKQLYPQLVHLLDLKYHYEGNQVSGNPRKSKDEKDALIVTMNETLEKIRLSYTYLPLHDEMMFNLQEQLRLRDKATKARFGRFMRQPLLAGKPAEDLPVTAQFTYYTIHMYYHVLNAGHDKAFTCSQKLTELIEKTPEGLMLTPRSFYNRANNFMHTALYAKRYDELKAFMKKYRSGYYKKLPVDFSMIEDAMEEVLLSYTLSLSIFSKDLALGLKTIAEYEKKLDQYEKIINPEMRVVLFYKMARILFASGDLKKALTWINRILNESDPRVRPDSQGYARILNLVIHLELGNSDLFASLIPATERFLKKNRMLYQVETVFLGFMKKSLAPATTKGRLLLLSGLKKKLAALSKDPLERNAFLHFDYLEWLESKMSDAKAESSK